MTNFLKMRENMILSQFLPGLIKKDDIINIFSKTSREDFLPDKFKPLAYSDTNIKVNKNRFLISPFNFAKILQVSNITKKDVVLLIGSGTGYEASILSQISATVISLEEDKNFFNLAEQNIKNLDVDNIINVYGSFKVGFAKHAPYDYIIILGCFDFLNNALFNQLANGGKLLVCERISSDIKESKLYVYSKSKNECVKRELFDLNLPRLVENKNNTNTFNFG